MQEPPFDFSVIDVHEPLLNPHAKRIRVLVVDDHHLVRQGYVFFLSHCADIEVIDEARNGVEAITLCRRSQPHVILMDVIMPIMNGIQATRAIHEAYPDVAIIALTGFNDEELADEALQAGAVTCISKQTDMRDLLEIIRGAVKIERYLPDDH
jgi:NarL family two-component system response regulator LiaR